MHKIRVAFTDFWDGFNAEESVFMTLLRSKFDVSIVTDKPDILFFSAFGNRHFHFKCPRVFYTGENLNPKFYPCDGSLTFLPTDLLRRNVRFPIFLLYDETKKLNSPIPSTEALLNRKFCNFIYSNPRGTERNAFFKILNEKRPVTSAGKLFNNFGQPIDDKRSFISNFKFTIAFENESYPGYTTEKLFEPLLEYSLPIYWGNPLAASDFQKQSFINAHDFGSLTDLAEYVLFLDNNSEKYLEYFKSDIQRENASSTEFYNSFFVLIEGLLKMNSAGGSLSRDLSYATKRRLFKSHRSFSRF